MDKIAEFVSNVVSAIQGTACAVKYSEDIDRCAWVVKPLYILEAFVENNKTLADCCSWVAAQDCATMIASVMCSKESSGGARATVGLAKPPSCQQYQLITDCVDPTLLILVFIGIVLIICGIIGCICDCLARLFK